MNASEITLVSARLPGQGVQVQGHSLGSTLVAWSCMVCGGRGSIYMWLPVTLSTTGLSAWSLSMDSWCRNFV
jgi:hypothetical protein